MRIVTITFQVPEIRLTSLQIPKSSMLTILKVGVLFAFPFHQESVSTVMICERLKNRGHEMRLINHCNRLPRDQYFIGGFCLSPETLMFFETIPFKMPNRPSWQHQTQRAKLAPELLCLHPKTILELVRVSMVVPWCWQEQSGKSRILGARLDDAVSGVLFIQPSVISVLLLPYVTEEMFVWISTSRCCNVSSSQQLWSHTDRCWEQGTKLHGERGDVWALRKGKMTS